MMNEAQKTPHAEVFDRIRNGLNVKVADLAPMIGITEAGLYRAVREKRIEAIQIGRAVFIPARVAAPLVGLKMEPVAA
ncbi:helix-turn-helix domain-containing protein [Methylobacterium organophilum]|uniref:Helix-turn-helix domain-containing protein n=1 Tax=Methylobacterium organophilum TaxID=410 RepID=A0ABQ4TDJ4_METOR|nr:helix-turn-helix domain-containing protein [Methylobacterium organophilum]GJE29129.1 hypothetical protein LKMONMHP_4008 [Methylobacterium organophilum]